MTADLTYTDLAGAIDRQFPHFAAYLGDAGAHGRDKVAFYVAYLGIYLTEHWQNAETHRQLAPLLQQMHTAADKTMQSTLNDLLLDICSSAKEHSLNLQLLLHELTPELQQRLLQVNAHWRAAACQLPRGGCC